MTVVELFLLYQVLSTIVFFCLYFWMTTKFQSRILLSDVLIMASLSALPIVNALTFIVLLSKVLGELGIVVWERKPLANKSQ